MTLRVKPRSEEGQTKAGIRGGQGRIGATASPRVTISGKPVHSRVRTPYPPANAPVAVNENKCRMRLQKQPPMSLTVRFHGAVFAY